MLRCTETLKIFDKKDFLESGALYAREGSVFLLWGKRKTSLQCPQGLAVCKREFFDESPLLWQSFEKGIELSRQEALNCFNFKFKKWYWSPPSFEDFKKQFFFLKKTFMEKNLKKGVPYVFETSQEKVNREDLESMIASGLRQDGGFLFGEWAGEQGTIGLSPELLVSRESPKKFKTMAVAATLTKEEFQKNPDQLLKDGKQIEEHEWVVEDIKKQLSGLTEFKVGERTTVRTSTLVHLLTPIEFEIKDQWTVDQVVRCLHPTAALGCYPRKSWKTIMEKFNQWVPRGSFGAPFGFSFRSRWVDFVVSIRSVIWNPENLKLGSGCGVIALSEIEKEWTELKNKRESVKKVFGL